MTRDQRICHAALLALDSSARVEENREKALKPKVSVLTLTYNHADFIEQNIQSVLEQQTDFPIEHIIADDDSDDGTQEIILRYAKRYPHIVPVFQRTRSYGSANTRALFESASSEYVALCDGDDYFTDPCKLQTQADFLDAHQNCALCFHPVEVVYEDGSERSRVYPPLDILPGGVKPFYRLADLLSFNFIQTNSVMYRWRFKDGLPDWFRTDILPGDLYWHILHAELGNIGFIDKKMSVYRRHRDAVYYTAEINTKVHSGLHGLEKLKAYAAINEHFKGEHFSILKDLMFGVFADSLSQAIETGNNENFFLMLERYPTFAKHFLVRVNDPQTGRS